MAADEAGVLELRIGRQLRHLCEPCSRPVLAAYGVAARRPSSPLRQATGEVVDLERTQLLPAQRLRKYLTRR